jgi:hypothetical protein
MEERSLVELLPLLAPLLLIWLALLVTGLVDLIRRERTRGPKWIWFLVVICFSILGPVVYFLIGREET